MEPASGAGGMALAAAKVIREAGIDVGQQLFVEAWDIAYNAFNMTYLQLAIAGIPGMCHPRRHADGHRL